MKLKKYIKNIFRFYIIRDAINLLTEFWEEQFRCRYPGSPRSRHNAQYSSCSGRERLTADNTEFEAQLQFVADAVWAFVFAIR